MKGNETKMLTKTSTYLFFGTLHYSTHGHFSLQILLDAFVLEKAIYELRYEFNNRPDWVHIPLRGILQLLATAV